MNTPASFSRDVLLARHAAGQPALDAQREALLARFAVSAPSSAARAATMPSQSFSLRMVFETLWRELFVPCRGAWVGFACVWVAILAVDRINASAAASEHSAEVARSDSAWLAVWLQQRRLLVELARDPFGPGVPASSAAPAPASPPLGFIDAVGGGVLPV